MPADELTKQTVDELLDQIARREPTPGGGSVAALAGSLACALGRMVAAYSVTKKTSPQERKAIESVMVKLRSADELMRALITQDAVAYRAMTAAAKEARGNPALAPRHQETVLSAIVVPMEIAAIAANALAVMDAFKANANRHLLSDLGVAAVLADATARAARYTVHVNLPELSDAAAQQKYRSDTDRIVERCDGFRGAIEAFVAERLEMGDSNRR